MANQNNPNENVEHQLKTDEPKEKDNRQLVVFTQNHDGYGQGEKAAFAPQAASFLVQRGLARLVGDGKIENSSKVPEVQATIPEVPLGKDKPAEGNVPPHRQEQNVVEKKK